MLYFDKLEYLYLENTYFNGDYKDHRKNLLFETEKARLPETMPAVEAYKSVRGLEIEKKKQKEEIQRLRTQYHEAQRKYNATCSTLNHAKRGESASKEKDESRKFILMPYDQILIKPRRDYKRVKSVTISGEIINPGIYSIDETTSIKQIIERSGGYSENAE